MGTNKVALPTPSLQMLFLLVVLQWQILGVAAAVRLDICCAWCFAELAGYRFLPVLIASACSYKWLNIIRAVVSQQALTLTVFVRMGQK